MISTEIPADKVLEAARDYVLVSRNIHLCSGKYRVLITRRPKNVYGGRFAKLDEAIQVRDTLEKQIAPKKAGGKRKAFRRTTQTLRLERRAAGLCQVCGDEPPKTGLVTCQSCLNWSAGKRREARREEHSFPTL